MMWLIYAVSAAILWGLSYSLDEEILKNKISPFILLLVQSIFATFVYTIIFFSNRMKPDFLLMIKNKNMIFLLMMAVICAVMANTLICYSIKEKNATIAGIIELAYPLFTIFFSYMLFNQLHINWGVIIGGVLIFIGVVLVSIGQ